MGCWWSTSAHIMQCNKNCNDNTRQTPTVQEARETKHKPAQVHMLCKGAFTVLVVLELQAKVKVIINVFSSSLKYLPDLLYSTMSPEDLFLKPQWLYGTSMVIRLHVQVFYKSSESYLNLKVTKAAVISHSHKNHVSNMLFVHSCVICSTHLQISECLH